MVESECSCGHMTSRVYDFTKCKRKKTSTNIESLPDELVFDILQHLPAQDIYNGARFVCKKWNKTIHSRNFIYSHLHHSTPGLIIQNASHYADPFFMTIRKGRIEISKLFNYKFKDQACSSCNGLVLDYDSKNPNALRIVNPLTKKQFITPPFDKTRILHHRFSGIAYVASSMEYKVVQTYYYCGRGNSIELGCAILTVGVDNSWRLVSTKHLLAKDVLVALDGPPLIIEGFMHWLARDIKCFCVFTLNVETEIITRTLVPLDNYEDRRKRFLSTGRSLSILFGCGGFSFDVWVMKTETGEWSKMYHIDLEPRKHRFEHLSENEWLVPAGWLKYGEVLVLRGSSETRVCIVYNVLTHEIDSFELDDYCYKHKFEVHTNSLVSLAE